MLNQCNPLKRLAVPTGFEPVLLYEKGFSLTVKQERLLWLKLRSMEARLKSLEGFAFEHRMGNEKADGQSVNACACTCPSTESSPGHNGKRKSVSKAVTGRSEQSGEGSEATLTATERLS
jgi:hypothetical protein